MTTLSYTVDSLEGGIRCLNDLVAVICEIRFEQSPGQDDTRIDSLLWIARDLAEGIAAFRFNEIGAPAEQRNE